MPTATPIPTPLPKGAAPAPPPTPVQPAATPDPNRVAQQQFCDAAVSPAKLSLPSLVPHIRIPPPAQPSKPITTRGGPRQEGTDPPPATTSAHIAVVDEASGRLLYEHDGFGRAAPASITKIVTTIVALEHQPDINVVYTTTVSSAAMIACDGSSTMGLEPGDHVKLSTLVYGMMLPSGNDAAEQVAISVGGSRERFVGWMNDKVSQLGLRDTHFVTPSGMDADDQYSSAYDMAMLGRYAMQHPVFRTIAATSFIISDDYYMHNLNPLLGTYPGADGVKIGYTDIAGRTIVASVTRDGHRVYVSLLGSKNLHRDCVALFDWVWKTFRWD